MKQSEAHTSPQAGDALLGTYAKSVLPADVISCVMKQMAIDVAIPSDKENTGLENTIMKDQGGHTRRQPINGERKPM